MSEQISNNIRTEFFSSVINPDVAFFDERRTGDLGYNLIYSIAAELRLLDHSRWAFDQGFYIFKSICVLYWCDCHHDIYFSSPDSNNSGINRSYNIFRSNLQCPNDKADSNNRKRRQRWQQWMKSRSAMYATSKRSATKMKSSLILCKATLQFFN